MNTHDMIELPPLPPLHIAPSVEPVDYPKVAQALMDYARAAIVADRQARGEPTAAEISDVIREITGCPDIKNGEDSLVVALGILFHRCATTQSSEPDYKQLFEQMCERCDALDAKLAEYSEREPVGYIMPTALKQLKAGGNAIVGRVSQGFDVAVYLAPQPAEPDKQHPDDVAVDAFAAAMKAKLKRARDEKGRGGWQDMSAAELSAMLREHVEKGDPVDVANLAMMLSLNGQRIVPAEPVKAPSEAKEALWKAYESLRELEKRIVLDVNQISGAAAASFAANRVLALLTRYGTTTQEQP